ncbi:MAG: hypothetical protein U0575_17300 [Phycisphaerales bacterium]|jgi:DNA-directed RNA polymerase specialized sigma24 family protein
MPPNIDPGSSPNSPSSATAPRRNVERLNSADDGVINDAFRDLHGELMPYTEVVLSNRHVHSRDAVTVIDTVLMRAAHRGAIVCSNDVELGRFLRRAVVNEIRDEQDRLRRRPGQMPGTDAPWNEPVAPEPGPATRVRVREDEERDRDGFTALLSALASVSLSEKKRAILDLFVVHGQAWEAVAAALDLPSLEAGRKAMSDMRTKILPVLMAPLRERLSASDVAVLDEFVIRRRKPDDAARTLGLEVETVIDTFGFRIIPAFEEVYGRRALGPLRRLMHKPKGR